MHLCVGIIVPHSLLCPITEQTLWYIATCPSMRPSVPSTSAYDTGCVLLSDSWFVAAPFSMLLLLLLQWLCVPLSSVAGGHRIHRRCKAICKLLPRGSLLLPTQPNSTGSKMSWAIYLCVHSSELRSVSTSTNIFGKEMINFFQIRNPLNFFTTFLGSPVVWFVERSE